MARGRRATPPSRRTASLELRAGDPLRPYVDRHKRDYDCSFLEPFGEAFAHDAASAFAAYAASVGASSARKGFTALQRSVTWITSHGEQHRHFISALRRDPATVSLEAWEVVLYQWRGWYIRQDQPSVKTKGYGISSLNKVLESFGNSGLIPRLRLRLPKNWTRGTRAKKSVAEVSVNGSGTALDGAVAAILTGLPPAERDDPQTRDFLAALADTGNLDRDDHPWEVAAKIAQLNRDRLTTFRAVAERHLLSSHNPFTEAQRELALRAADRAAIAAALTYRPSDFEGPTHPDQSRRVHDRVSPVLYDCPKEQGLANLLLFLDLEHGGFVPTKHKTYKNYCTRFGGVAAVESYLNADTQTLVAALILVLCDTEMNLSSALRLEVDCVTIDDDSEYRNIHARKARSPGKEVVAHLPVSSPGRVSAVRAIEMVLEMTARARTIASPEAASRLFIFRGETQSKVSALHEFTAREAFRRLQNAHPELQGAYTLDMIRPSRLLDTAYSDNGNLTIARAIADHSRPQTTKGYGDRWPVRVEYEKRIRRFQSLFQSVVIHSSDSAAERLGMTPAAAEELFQKALRTGLGVLCLNPRAGVQPGTRAGEVCTRPEACPGCSQAIFVASILNTVDLLRFQRALYQGARALETLEPARWNEYWIPWLAFSEVVVEKMVRGPTAAVLHEARRILADEPHQRHAFFPLLPTEAYT